MNAGPDMQGTKAGDNELRLVEVPTEWRPRMSNAEWLAPCSDLIIAHDPKHARSEAIRALRTRLLLARDNSPHPGTLAVMSAGAGEGRSELCAELAIAFAQLGRETLLIDADLRSPRQHHLFGEHNRSGLAQALHRAEAPWVYGVTGIPQLALLTSGGVPANPLELLSGGRFEQLVAACQRDYEFVLMDTPPGTRYSDGLAIAAVAGRVLLVTRAQRTSFEDFTELMRQLAVTSARVVGAVINRF